MLFLSGWSQRQSMVQRASTCDSMPGPLELTLELIPRSRVDVIDVRRAISTRFGDALDRYPRTLCCSFHTTAGYLDPAVASRLNQSNAGVMPYIEVFRTM